MKGVMALGDLSSLPNIGAVIEQKLNEAGILTRERLMEFGGKGAFALIRANDPDACFSMLCAIEGATRGIRWHRLTEAERRELRQYFDGV